MSEHLGYCEHRISSRNTCPECAVKLCERIAELEAEDHITKLESDNATIVEDAALVADENQRLKKIAEAAVRYLTHQDYDGLLNALRAEGYLVQQEDSK